MSEAGVSRAGTFSPDEWERVKDLVFECQSLNREEQRNWLELHCESERVRQEVLRLLAAAAPAENFLDTPASKRVLGPDKPTLPRTRIGRFQLLRQLGEGGMGVVYEAKDETLGRSVALKILRSSAIPSEDMRDRLLWDAKAASTLNHPNIVAVYEAGSAEGVDYVAMECVHGRTLAEVLRVSTLARSVVLDYAIQIAAALDTAHRAGIVHRDLKPGNIIVADNGTLKLVDFGLAKSCSGPLVDADAPATIEGRFAGTAAYVSPEQAEGIAVDFRSDIFSFGTVLYEMLTSQRAFPGASAISVLASLIHRDPAPPTSMVRDLDPRLDELIHRCLRKDRERRFQSIAEIRVRLQEIIEQPAPLPSATTSQPVRRNSAALYAGLGAAAALLVALGVYKWNEGRHVPTPPVALTKLTSDVGLTGFPALSSDGKLVVYASDRGGTGALDLWVQQVGGSDAVRLTADGADAYQPSFSTDATHIAYRSEQSGGGVYIIPALGGSGRLLVPQGRNPQFSPDGRWLACWVGEVSGSLYPGSAKILILPTTGGPSRAFQPEFASAAYPVWSPDSKRILFLGRRSGADTSANAVDWFIADLESGVAKPTGAVAVLKAHGLTAPPGYFHVTPHTWLARSNSILFTAGYGDAVNLWRIAMDSANRAGEPPQPVTQGVAAQSEGSAADVGPETLVAFASLLMDLQVWRQPLALDGTANGEAHRIVSGQADISSPSITADGQLVVFAARQRGGFRLVSQDLRTSAQQVVTTLKTVRSARLVVSADGRFVSFWNGKAGYLMGRQNSVPEQICALCGPPTHVNADGSQVLFESAQPDEKLQLWSRAGLKPLLTGADARQRMQTAGRFSPDGQWIAFCARERNSASGQIFIASNAPGRPVGSEAWINVSGESTTDREPYWSPDGSRLYFLSHQDGFRCIWARPLDPRTAQPTGPAYPVTHFHHTRHTLRGLTPYTGGIGLSASRDALVFTVAESTGNIWLQGGLPTP